MRYLLAFALALAASFLWHSAARSQAVPCASLDKMIEMVAGPKYREAPLFEALAGGQPVRAYANAGSGTWTLIFQNPAMPDLWCIGAAGSGFRPALKPIIGEPS